MEFTIGKKIFATAKVMKNLASDQIGELLNRHLRLEQGTLSDEDQESNRQALEIGARIFSAFVVDGVRYWIITEATQGEDDDPKDRSQCQTTILLPSEY